MALLRLDIGVVRVSGQSLGCLTTAVLPCVDVSYLHEGDVIHDGDHPQRINSVTLVAPGRYRLDFLPVQGRRSNMFIDHNNGPYVHLWMPHDRHIELEAPAR